MLDAMYLGAFESFIAYDEGRNSEAWCLGLVMEGSCFRFDVMHL